ncbi:MAG: EpsI domain-containing exosortase, partial [Sphingomonas sp.]|nr:EpsI domain-containing exosortase [Sphingomonas sp.]
MTAMVPGDRFVASVAAEGRLAAWRRHGFFLAVLVAFVLVIFARDVATLTALWWTNTTFGHCLFIGPVIGWLIWLRRFELATIHPVGWLPGSAIVAAGALTWLVGDAASVALA